MLKHTRASRYAGADRSNGGGGFGGEQQPRWRRRWPRFKPSRKIMNTATLRELGELAAAEVATWNPKELAAAARRAVTLWRCEQPRAAAAIRIMQRLRLLPSPSSPQVLFQSPPDRGGSDRGSEDRRSGSTGDASGSGRELETRLLADAGGKGRKETFPRSRGIGRAAIQFPAAPPRNVTAAAPVRRRVVTGGAYNYAVVVEVRGGERGATPSRSPSGPTSSNWLNWWRGWSGQLMAAARGGFGSRELSSFIWSLVALGYWQPPLVPLVSAFADYGAERLRSQPNPIATAMLLQVLAKARAAAASGQDTAAKLLELAPATTVDTGFTDELKEKPQTPKVRAHMREMIKSRKSKTVKV
ncbi:hypothetical protein VOLCADRAFT_107610 [Volvox carteri f. nagariensis]|uniref:Uncharacterized protein n=1 Tax=Volvox carteri f. nagariensis TaxID=3068 RepID=D8UF40_VOLCA|nr:uncharacterized protein VOLCADRAFT_107610 [Volvox carteri f. nagariensis]EFJ41651.1 hypothetical protein VOLCADRAFT_107610 [Volvox carteri f. nagariensis]|eukprot:XP_002957307.1 hypothetical protein VOLCADRAFT_107610 [Volvox carteri f. nagariensis]